MIDVTNYSLDNWLGVIKKNKFEDIFPPSCCFPNDQLRDEYLNRIAEIDDKEYKYLLRRFLVHNCSYGVDPLYFKSIIALPKRELIERINKHEFSRRLISQKNPWEGITWILDLLPDNAESAIDVIDSYLTAHIAFMPDWVISGCSDSMAMIRKKYFEKEHPRETLYNMKPKEFEKIIKALYSAMGYETQLTKASYDNGIDIIATSNRLGEKIKIFIQCKKYKENVGVEILRSLLGTVNSEQATKGILACSSNFTPMALKFAQKNTNIDLLNWKDICRLLNEKIGYDWPLKYNEIIRPE